MSRCWLGGMSSAPRTVWAPLSSLPVPQQKYTVKSGDTLSKIAKHYYGDANKYMKIFDANKGTLKDPDKIQVGQELVIPD